MSDLKDWRGTPVEIGSKVIYPAGRRADHMVEAEVVDIFQRETASILRHTALAVRKLNKQWWQEKDVVVLSRLDRVTVIG